MRTLRSKFKSLAVCALVACGAVGSAQAASWTSDLLTEANPLPAFENALRGRTPYASTSVSGSASLLTDGAISVGGSGGTVSVSSNGGLSYKLCDDDTGILLKSVRISSSWNDNGRSEIHVLSLSIKTVATGDDWVALPDSEVRSAKSGKCYQAVYANGDGSVIAEGVTDLKIEFGSQQNGFVGYSEVEAEMDASAARIPLNVSSCNGFGTVTSDPVSSDWKFSGGTEVALTATGTADAPFDRWFGDVPAGHEYDNPLVLTITDTVNITPAFKPAWVWENNVMTDGYWKVTTANDGTGLKISGLAKVADNAALLDLRKPIVGTDKSIISLAGSVFNQKTPTEMRLPDTLTAIGDCCRQMPNLKWLTLPANLSSLGHCAFYSCSKLAYVTPFLPDTLASWANGKQQFQNAPISGKLKLTNPALTSIPEQFIQGSAVTEIDISKTSVATLGTDCFRSCGSLVDVYLPSTLQTISASVFCFSTAVRSIYFKNLPTTINYKAFENMSTSTRFVFNETDTEWKEYLAGLGDNFKAWDALSASEKNGYTFTDECTAYGKAKIGSGGTWVYLATKPVTTVMLSVTTVPEDKDLRASVSPACPDSNELELPYTSTVAEWVSGDDRRSQANGYTLYKGAEDESGAMVWTPVDSRVGVSTMTIPEGTASGFYKLEWHFSDVGYAVHVGSIPESLGAVSLSDPDVEGKYYSVGSSCTVTLTEADGVFYRWEGDVSEDVADKKSLTLTMDAVKTLRAGFYWQVVDGGTRLSNGDWTFSVSGTDDLELGAIVTKGENNVVDFSMGMGDPTKRIVALGAVFGTGVGPLPAANDVTEVILPQTVTAIGDYAFRQMQSLRRVVLPQNLQTIGHCAFYGSAALEEVTPFLPDTLVDLGTETFKDCAALKGDLVVRNPKCGGLRQTGINGHFYGTKLTSVDFGSSAVSVLPTDSFREISTLTNVVFSQDLTSVAHCAFYGSCGNLKTMTFCGMEPPTIADEQSFTGWGDLACRIRAPKTPAWIAYADTTCAGVPLTVEEKAAFRSKGKRPPDRKIKLGGYGSYQYLTFTPVGGMMLIFR